MNSPCRVPHPLGKMAAGDDDTDCTLCYEAFSDSDEGRIPRSLSCGHTYCTGDCRDVHNWQGIWRESMMSKTGCAHHRSIPCTKAV